MKQHYTVNKLENSGYQKIFLKTLHNIKKINYFYIKITFKFFKTKENSLLKKQSKISFVFS